MNQTTVNYFILVLAFGPNLVFSQNHGATSNTHEAGETKKRTKVPCPCKGAIECDEDIKTGKSVGKVIARVVDSKGEERKYYKDNNTQCPVRAGVTQKRREIKIHSRFRDFSAFSSDFFSQVLLVV